METDAWSKLYALEVDCEEGQKRSEFVDAMREALTHHYSKNDLYRQFCNRQRFNPGQWSGDIESVPLIPVQVFKAMGGMLSTVENKNIRIKLESSATSGIPSVVLVDKITSSRQNKVMAKLISAVLGRDRKEFFVADLNPASDRSAMGARIAAVKGYLQFSKSSHFMFSLGEKGEFTLDPEKVQELENLTEPVVVFGFTYVLFKELIERLKQEGKRVQLPAGSRVLHIGGWKKLESEKVEKHVFNREVSDTLGVDEGHIHDVYGFTEQMGLNYVDCSAGWKHVPSFSDVLVKDPITGEYLGDGEEGLLCFLSPLPYSYPGIALQTDDLGILETSLCECGRLGKRFRVTGRRKKAEIRGCGDVLGTKILKRLEVSDPLGEQGRGSLDILYHSSEIDLGASDQEKLESIISLLRDSQRWLINQPVSAIVGLLDQCAQKWSTQDNNKQELSKQGLAFLAKWCSAANLELILDNSFSNVAVLDTFRLQSGNRGMQSRALPMGLIVHWLSGNVPMLGMLTLVQGLLTKNVNLLKAASEYSEIIPMLLNDIAEETYKSPGGFVLSGRDLVKCVSVVYYPHTRKDLATVISEAAQVRLAWGGAEGIKHVTQLSSSWNAKDVFFGPRLSFAVIGEEAIVSERKMRNVARRLATDVVVFDQTACASPHTVYLETLDQTVVGEFTQMLAKELDKAIERIPVTAPDEILYSDILTARAVGDFVGQSVGHPDGLWTILVDDEISLAKPTYGRVITLKPVADVFSAIDQVDSSIQTIGLALSGSKRNEFAEKALRNGAERCPNLGAMTEFQSPWDGRLVMSELVRWGTVGGP